MSNRPTPETDALILLKDGFGATDYEWREHSRRLERERDEAREVLREMWQSGDAFLPHVDRETINRWRIAAGWEEAK